MAHARIDTASFMTDIGTIDIKIKNTTRAQVNDLAEKVEALLTQWNADHEAAKMTDDET